MKVSDLMLDIATGDASVHDAYIQEAVGKVNVSNAIFKAAHQMTELDSSEMRYVQEAAENAGLPTDRKGLVKLVMESVNQQLAGVYDVATTTSKKITEALNKDFLLTKTIGKKLEVPLQGTICEYSTNLSTAIGNYFGGKKIDVGGKRFIKGDKAMEIAKNYAKGMSNLLATYGLRLDKSRVPVDIIGESFVPCATPKSLTDVSSNLSDAIRLFDTPDIVQESDFTDVVAYSDLVKVPVAIHGILSISENAATVLKDAKTKSSVVEYFTELNRKDSKDGKIVSDAQREISDNAPVIAAIMESATDNIVKGFTDTIYIMASTILSE